MFAASFYGKPTNISFKEKHMKFSDLNTPDYILKVFDELGIAEPTKVQERTIPVIEAGKDVIGK